MQSSLGLGALATAETEGPSTAPSLLLVGAQQSGLRQGLGDLLWRGLPSGLLRSGAQAGTHLPPAITHQEEPAADTQRWESGSRWQLLTLSLRLQEKWGGGLGPPPQKKIKKSWTLFG